LAAAGDEGESDMGEVGGERAHDRRGESGGAPATRS
jgi:hypothetical protein